MNRVVLSGSSVRLFCFVQAKTLCRYGCMYFLAALVLVCVCGCDCNVVMQMLYVCVLCASCGSSQSCVLHDLQFVNAGQGCNRRPYRRGILQSRSHNCFIEAMSVSFCLPHPVAVIAFMICRGLCACTEMLWMCVLYVSFGSKVRPTTFGCVAVGSALLFIIMSRLLVYSAGSGVNRVQVVLSGFSKRWFCFVQAKTLCRYGCMYFLAAFVLVYVDVMVMSSA